MPALVLREVTERVESLEAGCAKLVGTDTEAIVAAASTLLDDPVACLAMTAAGNPYGDGLASYRTEQAVAAMLGLAARVDEVPALDTVSQLIADLSPVGSSR